MKKVVFILCFVTSLVRAQDTPLQGADSIPLKLIPDPPALISWVVPYYPEPYFYPHDPYIVIPQDFQWIIGPTLSFIWIPPACGDSYYENGQLSSRIECVDSVMHGKAIYWDETGHKTTENTYAEGHLIKSKYYDSRGRVTSLSHYDYLGNYHGVCVEYTYDYQADPTKIVTHYEHGIKHGTLENYVNNVLTSKEIYDHDQLLESWTYFDNGQAATQDVFHGQYTIETRRYSPNGQMVFLETTDTTGANKLLQEWDEQGVLLKENKFENYKPVGTFLDYADTGNKVKKLTHYEHGLPVKGEEYNGDFLAAETFYKQGTDTYTVGWFENGDTAFFYERQPRGYFRKRWNTGGEVVLAFSYINSHLITGNAFYMRNDTAYYIVSTDNPASTIPIVQWVVYNADTLRMDYVRNGSSLEYQPLEILASNHYTYDPVTEKWVKHGTWNYYSGNQLQSVITYHFGTPEGRQVYYATTDNSSVLQSFGHFANGNKQNEWTRFSPEGKTTETYRNGLLEGETRSYDTLGNLISLVQYQNNERHGDYITYQDNPDGFGSLEKAHEVYENGKLQGWCRYYDNLGRLEFEGNYENGIRVKTWFRYSYEPDGTVTRTKIHYRSDGTPAVNYLSAA